MANDNLGLPANFSGDDAGGASSDTTVETITNMMVMVHNEVSSPVNNLESRDPVGEHDRMLTATDPTYVGSSSRVRNVSATPPSDQNGSPKIGAETRNGVVTVNNGYLPVKVTMDGIPVGRRVDLRDHDSYESLTQKLDDMFRDYGLNTEGVGPSYLLSGKSEYVLAYKDDEGDLMFAGDVPWPMFRSSVMKIRIMKNSESYSLGYRELTVEAAALEESKTTGDI